MSRRLTAVASLVAEHMLWVHGLSSCDVRSVFSSCHSRTLGLMGFSGGLQALECGLRSCGTRAPLSCSMWNRLDQGSNPSPLSARQILTHSATRDVLTALLDIMLILFCHDANAKAQRGKYKVIFPEFQSPIRLQAPVEVARQPSLPQDGIRDR